MPSSVRCLLYRPTRAGACAAAALSLFALAQPARAQNYRVEFTIDWWGPTVGAPDSFYGMAITEGDVLLPPAPGLVPAFGPLANPAIYVKAGPHFALVPPHLGLAGHVPCFGHPGGTPCVVEVDALDLGLSTPLFPNQAISGHLYFSTDKYAAGIGAPVPPTIWTEGPVFDLETDVLVDLGLGAGPLAPFAGPMVGSTAALDGDGLISGSGFRYRGVGLLEPGMLTIIGDNLDGLMFEGPAPAIGFPPGGVYFSLDAAFPDPLTGVFNTGSAAFHGFVGGDVLWTAGPGGPPFLYAAAGANGLDLMGPGLDDLDALILWENGVAGYQPPFAPYSWTFAGTDMLLFSVRRGSAVVGAPDSIFGLPINEGDVLMAPVAGGVSPFPGIFVAAENLGLLTTRFGPPVPFGDDVDALELPRLPLYDCNGNGREDALDIRLGPSIDANNNGIPEECEQAWSQLCFCPPPLGPCGNHDPFAGCANSTGVGALMTPSGSTSVAADDLVLTTTQMPPFMNGITFWSAVIGPPVPFYDGRRCLYAPYKRIGMQTADGAGTVVYGPGLAASEGFAAGNTVGFQHWYRDPIGPCAKTANVSSAVQVTFTP
jgi:hypothetical protein